MASSPSRAKSKVDVLNGIAHGVDESSSSKEQMDEKERLSRVNAAWEKMNSGLPARKPAALITENCQTVKRPIKKETPGWMIALGMLPKESKESRSQIMPQKRPIESKNGTSEENKKLATAALSAVRDATITAAAGKGKIQISEIRDFAGQEIEVKKLVDADSKEAVENAKASAAPQSALDDVLEQIKKKQKLSVLDKTKKDWNEFKEENKGLEEQLDAYKKSSDQYLDKMNFLQRTDYREFERERDARLSLQAKRRPDMRGDD